jgi:hypothetical protein
VASSDRSLSAGADLVQFANGISVTAWGRGAFSPLIVISDYEYDGNTQKNTGGVFVGTGPTWDGHDIIYGNDIRTDFRIHGNSEYVGFTITFTEDGFARGDDGAHIWAKPFGNDALKVTVGRFVNDTLRGKVGSINNGFECFSLPGTNEEDQIFTRFGTTMYAHSLTNATAWWMGNPSTGFMLSSAPIEGLFIGLLVGSVDPLVRDAYRYMHLGFGYEIADVGHLRAQWIGGWGGKLDLDKLGEDAGKGKFNSWFLDGDDYVNNGRIEAAFALTSVENLLLDFGLKFWLPISFKDYDNYQYFRGVDASLGAIFRADAFNIAARVDAKGIAGSERATSDDKSAFPMSIDVRLTPAYDFDAATLGLDFGLRITTASKDYNGDARKDSKTEVGFGLFVKKGFGNGHIKAGGTYTLAPSFNGKTYGQSVFMIPVVLEYAFF